MISCLFTSGSGCPRVSTSSQPHLSDVSGESLVFSLRYFHTESSYTLTSDRIKSSESTYFFKPPAKNKFVSSSQITYTNPKLAHKIQFKVFYSLSTVASASCVVQKKKVFWFFLNYYPVASRAWNVGAQYLAPKNISYAKESTILILHLLCSYFASKHLLTSSHLSLNHTKHCI